MDRTYIEIPQNSKKQIEISLYNEDGTRYLPSGSYYQIKGSEKNNTIIARTPAVVVSNTIHTQEITSTVTASAAEYDLLWEIRKSNDIFYHCTKLLVTGAC